MLPYSCMGTNVTVQLYGYFCWINIPHCTLWPSVQRSRTFARKFFYDFLQGRKEGRFLFVPPDTYMTVWQMYKYTNTIYVILVGTEPATFGLPVRRATSAPHEAQRGYIVGMMRTTAFELVMSTGRAGPGRKISARGPGFWISARGPGRKSAARPAGRPKQSVRPVFWHFCPVLKFRIWVHFEHFTPCGDILWFREVWSCFYLFAEGELSFAIIVDKMLVSK